MKYNPSDAAKACKVSVNTIRGWIRDYGEHFTPEARGESGNRLLSDKDMNTLKYIASLRAEGLQKDAIGVRLQETSIGEVETLVPVQPPSESPADSRQGQETAIVPKVDAEFITSIERRVGLLERSASEAKQSQREYIQGLAVGFIGAALFFLILLLLISIYHR